MRGDAFKKGSVFFSPNGQIGTVPKFPLLTQTRLLLRFTVDALGRAVSSLVRVEKPSDDAVWRPEKTRRFVEHREALERANRERMFHKAQERVTHLIRCLSWILDDRDKSVQGMAIQVVGQAARRLDPTAIEAIADLASRSKDVDVVRSCVDTLTEAAVAGNVSVVLTGQTLCKSRTARMRHAGLDILASFLRGFPTPPPPPLTSRSLDLDDTIHLPAGSAMQAVHALKKDTTAINSPGRQVIQSFSKIHSAPINIFLLNSNFPIASHDS